MVLEKFVNVFRYHFLDTETRFSRLSYLHAALISSNSSLKIPARLYFIKVKRCFELSAMICTYPWLDIHCSHVWYFLVFCTCDPKERKIKSQIVKELLYTGLPKKKCCSRNFEGYVGRPDFWAHVVQIDPKWSKLITSIALVVQKCSPSTPSNL